MSGDEKGKIRHWHIEDGKEVGTPMDAGSAIYDMAVSRDGKLIVSGTKSGLVMVWNVESHSKVTDSNAHDEAIHAVDVSPDTRKIMTGSSDGTACIWSLSTGEKLLGPLKHAHAVVLAAKFSPNGSLIATVTEKSIRVFGSDLNDSLLVEFPVDVYWAVNHSIAWANGSKQLFVSSRDGYIHHVDVSTKTMLSQWPTHSGDNPTCIALASNGTFIAASARSSVSFWDTTSQEQIGTVITYTHEIWSMTMSSNYDLVTGGDKKITLRALCDILPSHYLDNTTRTPEIQQTKVQKVDDSPNERIVNLERTIHELHNQLAESQQTPNNKIAHLEKTVQELRDELAESQCTANQEKNGLNETINSLHANFRTRDERSSGRITHLEQTNEELRVQLANAQRINRGHEQKHQCECLYAQGRIHGAAECLLELANTVNEDVRLGANKVITDFVTEFTPRCIMTLERVGDEASNAGKQDEAGAAYSTALLLGPTTLNAVLTKWASIMLSRGSADEASRAATKFKVPRFAVYRVICDALLGEGDGRLTEALKCFQQMQNELPGDEGVRDERAEWELDFRGRCAEKLLVEKLREISRDSEKHNNADALSHNPTNSKRSKEDVEPEPCRKKGVITLILYN
ncbi:WD40-repeat-containing domain protein [Boletus coccyginus]|nr:WD40-repeat-containing domain protein [Boletus coccyginus]